MPYATAARFAFWPRPPPRPLHICPKRLFWARLQCFAPPASCVAVPIARLARGCNERSYCDCGLACPAPPRSSLACPAPRAGLACPAPRSGPSPPTTRTLVSRQRLVRSRILDAKAQGFRVSLSLPLLTGVGAKVRSRPISEWPGIGWGSADHFPFHGKPACTHTGHTSPLLLCWWGPAGGRARGEADRTPMSRRYHRPPPS